MEMDRQDIEKRDFPIARRGYEPAAVDAHLAEIAAGVEELRHAARRPSETLAVSTGERVRAILEAAEASAAEIIAQAEAEAREMRAEAAQIALATRTDAADRTREQIARVSEATAEMLQRLDAMESELGTMIDGLRTGANRLNADLQLLEGNFELVSDVAGGPLAASAAEALSGQQHGAASVAPQESSPAVEPETLPEPAPEEVPAADAGSGAGPAGEAEPRPGERLSETDEFAGQVQESARLVALNMALNGSSREETDSYIAAHFDLPDRRLLLDEVYSSVQP
ncbi:MAG: DivIVA domain-containing protein [Solirubrobacteraceae bacterium]